MKRYVLISAVVSLFNLTTANAYADECLIVATGVTKGFKGEFDGLSGGMIGPEGRLMDPSDDHRSLDYLEGYDRSGDEVAACFNRALGLIEQFCRENRRAAFQLHGAHIGDAMLISSSYYTESKLNRWGMIICSRSTRTAHFRAWRDVNSPVFEARDIPIRCFKQGDKHPLDPYLY